MKKYNFNAGPSMLPRVVIENTAKQILDFNGSGLSLMEISHRAKDFQPVVDEAVALIKELLDIPEGYSVIFLGGGASLQFMQIPANFLIKKAGYVNSGTWAKKAMKEAKHFGETVEVASSAADNYTHLPHHFEIPADLDYLHITTNNTIFGTELREDLDAPVPLIADMSSDIMSRPVDVTKYGLIYGGAQKNVGPAGVTFVIVRKDILGQIGERPYMNPLPTMVDYRTHAAEEAKNISMFNTPPVLPIFVMHETLKWLKDTIGGVEEMNKINVKKSNLLYDEIERNSMFVGTVADKADRSIMNHCWVMAPGHEDKQDAFMAFAKECGMVGIKGHRSVGGFRASLYNACTIEDVEALVQCMQDFEKQF